MQHEHSLKTDLKIIPFYDMRLGIIFFSELYLECLPIMIIPFISTHLFWEFSYSVFWIAEELYYYTSLVWHWILKNFSTTKRKTCLSLLIFVLWMNFDRSTLLKSSMFVQSKWSNSETNEVYLPVVCPQRRFLKKSLRIQSIL